MKTNLIPDGIVLPPLKAAITKTTTCKLHILNPYGIGDWFVFSYDPKERLAFGYVSLFGDWNDELGYFSIDELESIDVNGKPLEVDAGFPPMTLEDIKRNYTNVGL